MSRAMMNALAKNPYAENRTQECHNCGQDMLVLNGAWLRWRRKHAGLSLRTFARLAGVSAAYVSDVELNRRNATATIELEYDRQCGRVKR